MASRALTTRFITAASNWLGSIRTTASAVERATGQGDRLADRAAEQGVAFLEQDVHLDRFGLQRLSAGKGQQLLGQPLAASRGPERGLDHPLAPGLVVRMALHQVQGADHHREQVVEVVRHAAGQLAHRLQLLRPLQGGLGLVALGQRGLHPLGQEVVDPLQIRLGRLASVTS